MSINNRKELFESLQDGISHSADKDKNDDADFDKYYLKTYIVESNGKKPQEISNSDYESSFRQTDDKSLHVLRLNKGKKRAVIYIDSINDRFWKLHTLGESIFVDGFVKRTVGKINSRLDHPWLNTKMLEKAGEGEKIRGFTLKHDNEFFEEGENTPVENLSMRLWGSSALNILDTLKDSNEITNSLSLSGIGVKHSFDKKEFIVDDISYFGKLTGHGNSVDSHLFLVDKVLKEYEEKINLIEENSLSYIKDKIGIKISGDTFSIILDKEIDDISDFIDKLLLAKKSFRLVGMKLLLSRKYAKVNAVDLHTGHKLNLEISPEWIRIYLEKGSCGNVVLRLFTNIQHHYDSQAELESGEFGKIF